MRNSFVTTILITTSVGLVILESPQQAIGQTPIDRQVRDCAVDFPQTRCSQIAPYGRAEGDPPVGPNPFDWHFPPSLPTLGRTDVDDTYDMLGSIHNYFWETFERDGGNGVGGTGLTLTSRLFTDASVHVEVSADAFGQDTSDPSAAVSSSGVIIFPTGEAVPDILGHEFAHAVSQTLWDDGTTFTGLALVGEAGAVGEAFSDLIGEVFELHYTGENDWIFGGDSPRPVRNMADPPALLNRLSGLVPPDRYLDPNFNGGGIHFNAGVLNKFSYLASEGGSFNGVEITGVGIKKVEQIWYRALTEHFSANVTFNEAYGGFLLATSELYGEAELKQVRNALLSVELNRLLGGGKLGDFNNDGNVDGDDIDLFVGQVGLATSEVAAIGDLDLIGDGLISQDDFNLFVANYVETSNGEVGTFNGDFNLDGVVDVLGDAFILVGNLGSTSNVSWASGDANADGDVDVLGDAFALVGNLGRSNANVVSSHTLSGGP